MSDQNGWILYNDGGEWQDTRLRYNWERWNKAPIQLYGCSFFSFNQHIYNEGHTTRFNGKSSGIRLSGLKSNSTSHNLL